MTLRPIFFECGVYESVIGKPSEGKSLLPAMVSFWAGGERWLRFFDEELGGVF